MAAMLTKSVAMPAVASRKAVKPVAALRPATVAAPVAAPAAAKKMMVWTPINNK